MTFDYKDHGKEKYIVNIEDYTKENENYRTTIWTGEKLQVTLMTIQPGDDIGLEVHNGIDQFLRVEEGEGLCQMGDAKDNLTFEQKVTDDDVILVPADTWHNVTNTSDKPLKIYSIYAGPDHVPGTIHKTHEDAKNDPNEH
ncbi:cupin domain-containing protein [Streptococcus halichoeri]|uniref:cupin domain-containing protein n=1 Tax=Streptococcus halichoeri TaxID=254785 RepID=UPI001359DDEE|nr:cupin domain-containing protein [Streptococcus halichoeri]